MTITGRAGEAEASCTFTISDPNPVTKIEVSGADSAFIDEFTLSSYELMTTRKNGEIGKFELKREYIADEDFAKLSVLGTHTLELSYKGVSGQWNIVIKNHEFEGIEFPSQTFFYDETPKSITVTGAPADTQIIYENNVHTDIGEYTATVTLSKQYYNTKTLTATIKIELKERSVTYVLGYEDVTNDNPGKFNVMLGFTLVAPDRSEITDGKHFSGWFTDIEYIDSITEIAAGTDEDITLYAKWELPYTVNGSGAVSATDFGETLTEITVIPELNGIKVTAIGSYGFYDCTSLANITLPDGLISIGDSAFSKCKRLANITLPDGLTSIGAYAFSNCTSLASIIIPDSVTSIGRGAFEYCEGLTGIILPERVKLIENSTFRHCTSLANITLPDGLTSIGEYAFSSCTSLANITLPDGLISIGNSAFNDCTSLANITLPDGLISIGDSAFEFCNGLANIILPDSLTTIGSEAFLVFNSNWKSVVIPNNVTFIGVGAFSLGGLESITFKEGTGNGVYHIEGNCLIETATKTLVAGCNNSVIPKDGSVTIIGEKAFAYSRIKSITIPECVVKICKDAFHGCYGNFGLESVIFENPNWYYTNDDGEEIIIPSRYLEDPSLAASWLGGNRAEYEWKIIVK